MGDLVRVDLDVLPQNPVYRPIRKQAWFSGTIPLAVGVGVGVGLLVAVVHPVVLVASFAALAGRSILRRRQMHGLLRENDDGVALLASGEVETAAEVFDELCRRGRRYPGLHSLMVLNRGVTHLEAGELDDAFSLLSAVVHAGWIGPRGGLALYYSGLLARVAMTEALRGRLDAATAWQTRAHAASSDAKRGWLLPTDVVLEARKAEWERVVELVEERWAKAENLLTAKSLRSLRMFQAFALEQGTAARYRVESRDSDRRRSLDVAREGRRGQFDHLAARWPELREFLDRNAL